MTEPFSTKAELAAAVVPATVKIVFLAGCAAIGDGGDLFMVRVSAQPTHLLRVRSTDRFMPDGATDAVNGGWWAGATDRLRDAHFADLAIGDGDAAAEDWTPAVDALYLTMAELGRPGMITGVRRCRSQVDTQSGTRLEFSPGAALMPTGHSSTGAFLTNVNVTQALRQQSDIVIADARIDGDEYPSPVYFAAAAVTSTTVVLPVSWVDPSGHTYTASLVDNHYNGFLCHVVTGAARSKTVSIIDYAAATRTLTVGAWPVTPSPGDVVVIGFNDNAFGAAWGASNVVLRDAVIKNFPMEKHVPFGSGAKACNYERGNTACAMSGGVYDNVCTAVFVSGLAGTMANGARSAVVGVRIGGFHASNCGSVITAGNIDSANGISAAGDELNAVVAGFTWEKCGHAPLRIVGTYRQKSGVINLMGANGVTIENGRGFNPPSYPSADPGYPSDYDTRCGFGLSGPIGALIWGHARNSTLRNLSHTGDADAVVHVGRVRALGDDAGPSAQVSQCFAWEIDGAQVLGSVDWVITTDPDFPIADNQISGYWRLGVIAAANLISNALENTTTLMVEITELQTGKRIIGTPKAIIAAGNKFDSFAAGTTDLRAAELARVVSASHTLNDDSAVAVTPPARSGLVALCGDASLMRAVIGFRVSATPQCAAVGTLPSNIAVTTGALNGTTGTNGNMTVSAHTDGKIYIENRRGGALTFTLTWIG